MSRRKLPEEFYDFFVHDGRDGEEWGPFDTLARARVEARARRKPLESYTRCVITIRWSLSEEKTKNYYDYVQANL